MNTVSVLKEQLEAAHAVLEQTMEDVTEEQANWAPPGIANALGATYAHAVSAEDAVVNGMLRGGATLIASASAGKVGLSELPPMEGDYGEWARRVKVDLPPLTQYAQAVYKSTGEWLASVGPADLERAVDLTGWGLGNQSLAWVLANILIWHIDAHCGEISCLKGLQGARGDRS